MARWKQTARKKKKDPIQVDISELSGLEGTSLAGRSGKVTLVLAESSDHPASSSHTFTGDVIISSPQPDYSTNQDGHVRNALTRNPAYAFVVSDTDSNDTRDYAPIAKNQMREIMLKVAWKGGSGEISKTADLGIVYDTHDDNGKLSVGVEDRKANKVYRLILDLGSLDQTLILKSDPKLTMSAFGYFVHSKSTVHDWVKAIDGMRQQLLTRGISESNVWKLASACDKVKIEQDKLVSQPDLQLTSDFVIQPISMADPDDKDFLTGPPQMLLDTPQLGVMGPAQKTKTKRKQTAEIDIRDNVLTTEEDPKEVNIDPKDDDQIRAEAEKIKKYYVMNCQEIVLSIWRLLDPVSDFVHRPVIQSYVLELERFMKGSVETPSAATVIPYMLVEDENKNVWRDFKNLNSVEEVTAHVNSDGLFMVISGAHSTRAMKQIVRSVIKDPNNQYYDRAVQLKSRSCRILRGDIPKADLVKISLICNLQNKTMGKHMEISFVDLVRHGWEQYEASGHDKLRQILQKVMNKELLLKVDSKYSEDKMSLQEYAEALEAEEATVKMILAFYADKYKATDLTREILEKEFKLTFEAIAKLTALLKLKKVPKSSKRGGMEPSAKRVKGDDGVIEDKTFENRLQYIWINTRGSPGEKTEHPWFIAPFNLNLAYDDTDLPRLRQVDGGGDWSSAVKVKGDQKVELSFHNDSQKDYDLHTIKTRTTDEESDEEMTERLRRENELKLLSLAPRYTDKESKDSYTPPSLEEAGVDISTQPVILASADNELQSEADFEDMMDPEQAFIRRRGLTNVGAIVENSNVPVRRNTGAADEYQEDSGGQQGELTPTTGVGEVPGVPKEIGASMGGHDALGTMLMTILDNDDKLHDSNDENAIGTAIPGSEIEAARMPTPVAQLPKASSGLGSGRDSSPEDPHGPQAGMNLEIDEYGSMNPLVITPTVITTVKLSDSTSGPQPLQNAAFQAQKSQSEQPTRSNQRKKETGTSGSGPTGKVAAKGAKKSSTLQIGKQVRRDSSGQGSVPKQPNQGVRPKTMNVRKEKK
ncbi:hypothetical protein R1sor_010314 [Riccia sorocarpa]|uniref:Uncharacterized protein n=1 Tax=Riccia sorocarpa TaxID=122646 RepID=A0ABD3HXR0_9MARC